MLRYLFAMSFALICAVSAAQASDAVVGLWKTEPDRKKLTSHIEVRECGVKICGKVLEAFDIHGKSVKTRNVGRELFWDVEDLGGGNYGNGTVFVPLLNVKASASMKLAGNTLKVTGCKGKICDGQTWSRLK